MIDVVLCDREGEAIVSFMSPSVPRDGQVLQGSYGDGEAYGTYVVIRQVWRFGSGKLRSVFLYVEKLGEPVL